MAEKENLRIRLDGDLKARFEADLSRLGMSQQEAIVRLVGMFIEQPAMLQAIILGTIPHEDQSPIARMLLERMANQQDDHPQTSRGRPPVPRLVARTAKKTGENQ